MRLFERNTRIRVSPLSPLTVPSCLYFSSSLCPRLPLSLVTPFLSHHCLFLAWFAHSERSWPEVTIAPSPAQEKQQHQKFGCIPQNVLACDAPSPPLHRPQVNTFSEHFLIPASPDTLFSLHLTWPPEEMATPSSLKVSPPQIQLEWRPHSPGLSPSWVTACPQDPILLSTRESLMLPRVLFLVLFYSTCPP